MYWSRKQKKRGLATYLHPIPFCHSMHSPVGIKFILYETEMLLPVSHPCDHKALWGCQGWDRNLLDLPRWQVAIPTLDIAECLNRPQARRQNSSKQTSAFILTTFHKLFPAPEFTQIKIWGKSDIQWWNLWVLKIGPPFLMFWSRDCSSANKNSLPFPEIFLLGKWTSRCKNYIILQFFYNPEYLLCHFCCAAI